MLSAYEFAREFDFDLATHPLSMKTHQAQLQDLQKYHAVLTAQGIEEVANCRRRHLRPQTHYVIQEEGGPAWLPLGHGEYAQPYRHDWVMVQRKRPHVPVLYGAQGVVGESCN